MSSSIKEDLEVAIISLRDDEASQEEQENLEAILVDLQSVACDEGIGHL